jgi:carboxymethylenebutenolidase
VGQNVELTASDGHRLDAYLAQPSGKTLGGIVVIQEIFGVTRHIRDVADQYAAAGFTAIAPALFDRVECQVDVAYTDMTKGFSYVQRLTNENVMLDVQASVDRVSSAGKVGIVGFCWGGTMAYLASARLRVAATVAYYGGGINNHTSEKPRCPIMFHFGEKDSHIPTSAVDKIKADVPGGIFHLYPAGHGFNCTDRDSFDPESAKLALQRSLEFFHKHVG